MSKFIGLPTLVVPLVAVGLATVGLTSASANFGEYTTRVPEGRLFINGGRILRCDLFFSVPGAEPVVAPKGSELKQTVPPVVWQYSGLLPVSDYLKTVAIHSVSSADKVRPWQDVQATFYNGLRVEGVDDADAKIAYAGAYAFAPRWPLVEFVEVAEEIVVYPDTVLYKVEYIQPNMKGLSLEDYRTLALQILKQPENVSLDDIRGVIDVADASKVKTDERASLGGIGNQESGSFEGIKVSGNGVVMRKDQRMVTNNQDHKRSKGAEKVAEPIEKMMDGLAVAIPELPIVDQENTVDQDVIAPVAEAMDEILVDSLESDVMESDSKPMKSENVIFEDSETMLKEQDIMVTDAGAMMDTGALKGPQDDWIIMPDGSMVLRSIERLVSEKY